MKTILFGNGLNLLNDYSTWNDLLVRIDDKLDEDKIPNTMQFEAEVLGLPEKKSYAITFDGDPVTFEGKQVIFTENSEIDLKKKIAEEMTKYESNEIYQRIASMKSVTHFVTTNYDDVMKRSLESLGYKEYEHIKNENIYSLRRRVSLRNEEDERKHIWNIHGEISFPQTIMLGLHQYCGSVGRISEFLNGKYKYSKEKETLSLVKIQERLGEGIANPFSWIDLFFISDIYIIGFSLLYEEIDLWWILTRRKRLIRQGVNITNHIYFCGDVKPGKKKLLLTMGVEIIEPDIKARKYIDKYHSLLDKIN